MKHYAFAHPGKIGDLLYILPLVRKVCERDDAVADIYTSELCRPAERLFRYQKHVNDFIVPPEYSILNTGQGVQPWNMPVHGIYDKVYQLGYQHFPQGPLHQYIASVVGEVPVGDPQYDFYDKRIVEEPYVVVAHCSTRSSTDMYKVYKEFLGRCPIRTVQTGIPQDWVESSSINMTGIDLLEVLPLLAHAKAFIGFYSGILVLANGFHGLPKIITMWRGVGEQHGLHVPITVDLAYPTPDSLLQTLQQYL